MKIQIKVFFIKIQYCGIFHKLTHSHLIQHNTNRCKNQANPLKTVLVMCYLSYLGVRHQLKQVLCKWWWSLINDRCILLVKLAVVFFSTVCLISAFAYLRLCTHHFKCMLKMMVDKSEKVNICLRKAWYLYYVFKLKCGGSLCGI